MAGGRRGIGPECTPRGGCRIGPPAPASATGAVRRSLPSAPMASRARILVAEDEASVAQAIVSRLARAGHEVRWVRQIRELRAELTAFAPHLILLDTTLDTHGLEFFQATRFAPEHPPAGMIILTPAGDMRTK